MVIDGGTAAGSGGTAGPLVGGPAAPKSGGVTATTTDRSVDAQLAKLERAVDQAHVKARDADDSRQAWRAERQQLEAQLAGLRALAPEQFAGRQQTPCEGTEAAAVAERIAARGVHYPHEAAANEATATWLDAQEQLQLFKVDTLAERLSRLDTGDAGERIHRAAQSLTKACDQYAGQVEQVRQVVLDTWPRGGRRVGHDTRVDGWAELPRAIAATEVEPPSANCDPTFQSR